MAFEDLKFAGMLWKVVGGEQKNLSAAVFYPCHLNKKKREEVSRVNLSAKLFDRVDVPFICF